MDLLKTILVSVFAFIIVVLLLAFICVWRSKCLIHMPIHVLYSKTLEYLVLFLSLFFFRTNVYNVVNGFRCVYQIGVQFH